MRTVTTEPEQRAMTTIADQNKPLSLIAQFRRRVECLRISRMAHREADVESEPALWEELREATRDLNDWTAMYADDLLKQIDDIRAENRRLTAE